MNGPHAEESVQCFLKLNYPIKKELELHTHLIKKRTFYFYLLYHDLQNRVFNSPPQLCQQLRQC